MRIAILAVAGFAALTLAGPAVAQHRAQGGHWQGSQWRGNTQWHGAGNWGGSVGGRWIGGTRAPGGWSAYVRPVKGWALPNYWLAPNFYVTDWNAYGLDAPGYGYHWSRYYDDAVLVDQYGRVMDWVDAVDWDDGYDGSYADSGDGRDDGGWGPGAAYPAPPPRVEVHTYGAEGGPPPPPSRVVVTRGPGCGCVVDGYYYPPTTTTTVTVTSVPMTTTTTQFVDNRAPAVRHWRAPPRPSKLVHRHVSSGTH